MNWLIRYQLRYYVGNSIWILPIAGMIGALGAVRLTAALDRAMGWESTFQPDAARAVLTTLSASMFTFIVFVSSALLLVVQLASAQLTPRIIAMVFKDLVTKCSLTIFVFAFAFSLAAVLRITGSVPLFTTDVAAYSCAVSLGVFLYLIDHVGKALRASVAVRSVAAAARVVIDSTYPRRLDQSQPVAPDSVEFFRGKPSSTIRSRTDGAVLAFDVRGLVALGERADCVIELVPQVGDFIAANDPIFRVFGDVPKLAEGVLSRSIALGQERTMEQDPAFAFRILVDIASKGLSPGINDPTTAVLAIDQIHSLLRAVGDRDLGDGRMHDSGGRLRLVYRTPSWEDLVVLAVTEIRQFGSSSIQIARRLRAMLEDLIENLPETRAVVLRMELALLGRSADQWFAQPEDRALAEAGDLQGVGGTRRHGPPDEHGEPGPA
jgi:uncharacterized membrane protein